MEQQSIVLDPIKTKHRAMWALGDYDRVATEVIDELGRRAGRRGSSAAWRARSGRRRRFGKREPACSRGRGACGRDRSHP